MNCRLFVQTRRVQGARTELQFAVRQSAVGSVGAVGRLAERREEEEEGVSRQS